MKTIKVGETVKVKWNGEWKHGKVLEVLDTNCKIGIGEPYNYKMLEVFQYDLKRFQELPDAQHQADIDRDMPIGLALAQEAITTLLPGEDVSFKDSDNVISGYYGAVTIDPVVNEFPTIGGFIERTAYQVTMWKYYYGTRYQPEEYSDVAVGTYPTIQQAVQVFLKTIFELKSNDYWQSKSDQAMADECL